MPKGSPQLKRAASLSIALLTAFLCLLVSPQQVRAQEIPARIGLGADLMINPFGTRLSGQAVGIGLRGRMSMPINQDVSLLGGLGLTGFVLDGRRDATYLLNPEVAVVVTLPLRNWAPYILGGFSGFIPLSGEREGGPAIHGGMGWVRPLAETSVYVEINPSLVLYERTSILVVPFRVGIIL